jgi:large subunit ribosomal protein L31e
MATLERTYNVPLRKEFQKTPRYRRSKRAVAALRAFIAKNMKSEDVRIGKHLNQYVWENGIKNPPHHVKVQVVKDDAGVVRAELFGVKYDEPTKEEMEKAAESRAKEKGKKVTEKVDQKPELAEEAVKKPKAVREEMKAEADMGKLEREEKIPEHVREEEEDIQAGLDAVKVSDKPKAAKPKARKE